MCVWDLFADASLVTVSTFSGQGSALSLSNIFIRAINNCGTPDQMGYAIPPDRITQTYNNNLSLLTSNYIVGTDIADGALASTGPCAPVVINSTGNSILNSNTHRFRIDIDVRPDLAPGITTPGIYDLVLNFWAEDDAVPGASVSATYSLRIEILPIMEISMNSPSLIDFSFTTISSYIGGQVRYGATSIYVSSSVEFDLVAVGTSTVYENSGNAFWDVLAEYTAIGNNQVPLGVLELHQTPSNPSGATDYSAAFASGMPSGNNDIMVGSQFGMGTFITIDPSSQLRSIAGEINNPGVAMQPGSHLPFAGASYNPAEYKYKIDYRLLPMLPTTFGRAIPAIKPGIYKMEVRYILTEDQ